MALSEVMPEDDLRTFTVADCEFLAGFATGPNWKTVQPAQRLYYQGLRARLRSLSLYVASTARTGIPLSRKESAQAPSGRAAGDMWCCVYPTAAGNSAFALQVAVIVSPSGVEVCFCLGAGSTEGGTPEVRERYAVALDAAKDRLSDLPEVNRTELSVALRNWDLRKRWRLASGTTDFDSLDDWLEFAGSADGNGASISRNLTPPEFDDDGFDIGREIVAVVESLDPVLTYIYGDGGAESSAWDEFVNWAEKMYAVPTFDADERDYKVEIGARLQAAREAVDSPEWLERLKAAFGGNNNLSNHFEHGPFLRWAAENQDVARQFLRDLWGDDTAGVLRGAMFDIPTTVLRGRAARTSIASFLLMGVDVFDRPFFRKTVYEEASRLAGREIVTPAATVEDLYNDFLAILDALRHSLDVRAKPVRDRLDAQGIVWMLTRDPPDIWSADEQRAFLVWRGGGGPPPPPPVPASMIPSVPSQLAAALFVDRSWLQEIVDLLNEKRQAIFYGPPGTGKTYIAQRLGEHVEQGGGTWELIQFHPAFSYEDFFEGFRPAVAGTGTGVAYELRHGPLRRIAERARNNPNAPHVLVIDEINRGNIAKIFGELFFLLEYRDRGVALQYSPDERFSLPKNLYVIGTMNTADRSIALVDAALRRRFYFIPFMPTEKPLKDVLRKWLASEGLDGKPAVILDRLNAAIGAQEFSIGHSYFMGARGSDGINLDWVWRFAIKPLLEEHYYGTRRNVDIEFGFDALEGKALEVIDESLASEIATSVEP